MKLRWKILLVLALAILLAWVYQTADNLGHREARANVEKCEGLKMWYDGYNDEYFGGKLPKDVVIDYSEKDPRYMASTYCEVDSCRIAFNERYSLSARYAHVTLLHEMCHVSTRDEQDGHGPRWRSCMLSIDAEGAFRANLIDGYRSEQ